MARPKKKNADYFPHDSDMRNDPKVKALRRKFGFEGYAVWSMLLEILTDADYFEYEWSDLNIELLAGDFDLEPDLLRDIVKYCFRVKLLFIENDLIFTPKMKERFEGLLSKRKPQIKEFRTSETPKKEVKIVGNPQSKVKESKVKESKGETIIINNVDFLNDSLKSPQWIETACMQNSISKDVVKLYLKHFEAHLITTEEEKKTSKEFKTHFIHWLNKKDLSAHREKRMGKSNQY